jgi:hypothetical protein
MIALSRKPGKLDTGLIGRGLEGFQNRASVELQPSGVMELDAVLGGGLPPTERFVPQFKPSGGLRSASRCCCAASMFFPHMTFAISAFSMRFFLWKI